MQKDSNAELWPVLPYEAFKPTAHLLHMCVQAIGKLKLHTPFEPHWANVALWITSQGLTSGPIPYHDGTFTITLDMIHHEIHCTTSWDQQARFSLHTGSVAKLIEQLFTTLKNLNVDISINPLPQEIPNPIPFPQDTEVKVYTPELAHAWWQILLSSYNVMQQYHAHFLGATPPIGLMWGTFDLRDARYNGERVPTIGENAGYIRRNAMDMAQVEAGWWIGSEQYPKPAYFSFIYPAPNEIANAKIQPKTARFDQHLQEFILDYDAVRTAANPEADLLAFLESTYSAGTTLAGWDPDLIGPGIPE